MVNRKTTILLFLPLFLIGLITCDNAGDNGIISSWVQAGPNGTTIARVITLKNNCPEIALNGSPVQMEVRHSPDNNFPILVCEINIPPETISASVAGRFLRLPVKSQEAYNLGRYWMQA